MCCWCRVSEDSNKLLMRLKLSVAGVCHGSSASDKAASDATFQPLPPSTPHTMFNPSAFSSTLLSLSSFLLLLHSQSQPLPSLFMSTLADQRNRAKSRLRLPDVLTFRIRRRPTSGNYEN